MTVRVISEKPVRTKRATCPTCCYELEFTGEDVNTMIDCDGDSFQTIVCPRPECQKRNGGNGRSTISVRWT